MNDTGEFSQPPVRARSAVDSTRKGEGKTVTEDEHRLLNQLEQEGKVHVSVVRSFARKLYNAVSMSNSTFTILGAAVVVALVGIALWMAYPGGDKDEPEPQQSSAGVVVPSEPRQKDDRPGPYSGLLSDFEEFFAERETPKGDVQRGKRKSANTGSEQKRPIPRQSSAGVAVPSKPSSRDVNKSERLTAKDIFAKASPAVVRIEVFDRKLRITGSGSGFFVSPDGLIATNYHVIEGAFKAVVTLTDGSKHPVEGIAAVDRDADLALLKIDGAPLPALELAGPELPAVGTKVFAIGSPKGLTNTLSEGLVSGHRTRKHRTRKISVGIIQTTAAISPGSSGGPLLSEDGNVVGVTTSSLASGQNLNFAVAVASLKGLIDRRGEVRSLANTNSIDMQLTFIPAGVFMMGSLISAEDTARWLVGNAEGAKYYKDEHPQHQVVITKPFYMQTTEVTQGQWEAIMRTRPWKRDKNKSPPKEGFDYAAMYVSWDGAAEFCRRLSRKEGKRYRLPTEAEWEYACRAGSTTVYSFGNDISKLGEYAWFNENTWDVGQEYAHRVGLKKPNALGLFDMLGNVDEWCQDRYGKDYYGQSPVVDPSGPSGGSSRVRRGGGWFHFCCRSAERFRAAPDFRSPLTGFRVVVSSK